jgi:uncharacterized protein YjbJ (UPF0337 family)
MNDDEKLDQDAQELKGHVEQAVGRVFGDGDLVARGLADQLAAHARRASTRTRDAARLLKQNVKARAMHKLGALHQQLHEAADDAAQESKKSESEGEHR